AGFRLSIHQAGERLSRDVDGWMKILIAQQIHEKRSLARLAHDDGSLACQAAERDLPRRHNGGRRIQAAKKPVKMYGGADVIEGRPQIPNRKGRLMCQKLIR